MLAFTVMDISCFPPFHDHHTHVSFYSALSGTADLSACSTEREAIEILRNASGSGNIIFARGWKNNLYDISKHELEQLPPVAICNISLHSFKINKRAREIFYQTDKNVIKHIDSQEWVEHNLNAVFALFTDYGNLELIPTFVSSLEKQGIYEMEDMSVSSEKSALFLAKEYADRIMLWAEMSMYEKFSEARKFVHGIKLFADGALGARTAALEHACGGGNIKFLLHDKPEMRKLLKLAAECKPAIAVHAIGDAAIEQTLDCVEDVFHNEKKVSIRIEHAQMISISQAMRAKKMGIILSMQPNFSDDSLCYADRLSEYYINANNPFRMLIDEAGFIPGKDLLFGSDGMPHGMLPAAISSVKSPLLSQRLSVDELIAGYKC